MTDMMTAADRITSEDDAGYRAGAEVIKAAWQWTQLRAVIRALTARFDNDDYAAIFKTLDNYHAAMSKAEEALAAACLKWNMNRPSDTSADNPEGGAQC